MIRKNVLGGGKTLLKSICYIILIVNFVLSVCFIKSDIVSARKPATQKNNAKKSTKRAAAVGKKRAATNGSKSNGNNKRAATSNARKVSAAKKLKNTRAMRAPASKPESVVATDVETTVETAVISSVCPVEKVISRKYDDNGEFTFYDKKELCSEPENASVYKWTNDLKSSYPLNGVSSSDAYYYKCNSGYVMKTVDGVRSCVNVFQTCPLNVVVERNDNGYVSSETGEQCDLPTNAEARLVKDGENTRGDLDDASAYIIECKANKYSAVIEGVESDLHLQCLSCPAETYSSVGAKSVSECVKDCSKVEGMVLGKNGECVWSCNENATVGSDGCVCNDGYFGVGYGEDGCSVCPVGSYCKGGEKIAVDKSKNQYTAKTGLSEAKTCPSDAKSNDDGSSCVCNNTNATFDIESATCKLPTCPSGQVNVTDGSCKETSSLTASDFNQIASAVSGSSTCPSGTLDAGVYLVTLRGGKGGNSGSGGKISRSGAEGGSLSYVFTLPRSMEYMLCAGENGKLPVKADTPNEGGGGGGGSWLRFTTSSKKVKKLLFEVTEKEYAFFVAGGGGGGSSDIEGDDGGGGGGGGGIGAGGAGGEGSNYNIGGYGGRSGIYAGGDYKKWEVNCKDGTSKKCGNIPNDVEGFNTGASPAVGDPGRSGGAAGGGNGGNGGSGQEWFDTTCGSVGGIAKRDTIYVMDEHGNISPQVKTYGGKGGTACKTDPHMDGYPGEASHTSNTSLFSLSAPGADLYKLK